MKIPERIIDTINQNKDQSAFYIYDMQRFREQMNQLEVLPNQVKTFYAMKVNPNYGVVREALHHPKIEGVEVASLGELTIAAKAQETPFANHKRFIYTGPSKSEEELKYSIENRVRYLNAESWLELLRLNKIASRRGIDRRNPDKQGVLLRLNTKHEFDGNSRATFGGKDTQFGIPQQSAEEYIEKIKSFESIRLDGVHMYPASGILDYNALLSSVESAFNFTKELEEKTGFKSKVIDFGGGFGIDYTGDKTFDIESYAKGLEKLITQYGMEETNLYLELGRYLAADMGYFVTEVNDIKTMESGKKAVLCHAGTNAHKRAQLFPNDKYKTTVIPQNREPFSGQIEYVRAEDTFDVFGPLCTPVDAIAKDRTGLEIRVGDYIVQTQVGAYGRTMSPQEFLSHAKVPEIILK